MLKIDTRSLSERRKARAEKILRDRGYLPAKEIPKSASKFQQYFSRTPRHAIESAMASAARDIQFEAMDEIHAMLVALCTSATKCRLCESTSMGPYIKHDREPLVEHKAESDDD